MYFESLKTPSKMDDDGLLRGYFLDFQNALNGKIVSGYRGYTFYTKDTKGTKDIHHLFCYSKINLSYTHQGFKCYFKKISYYMN